MNFTQESLLSWQMGVWLGTAISVVIFCWRRTRRIFSAWKRSFWRAFMISLAFTPTLIPAADEFGRAIHVPAWYSLFVAARDTDMVALFAGIVPVLLVGVILWAVGMTIHFMLNSIRAHS